MTRAVNKVEEQQCELETLRDAAVQKKIMQEKLDRWENHDLDWFI